MWYKWACLPQCACAPSNIRTSLETDRWRLCFLWPRVLKHWYFCDVDLEVEIIFWWQTFQSLNFVNNRFWGWAQKISQKIWLNFEVLIPQMNIEPYTKNCNVLLNNWDRAYIAWIHFYIRDCLWKEKPSVRSLSCTGVRRRVYQDLVNSIEQKL